VEVAEVKLLKRYWDALLDEELKRGILPEEQELLRKLD
jgi:hypothetical protein